MIASAALGLASRPPEFSLEHLRQLLEQWGYLVGRLAGWERIVRIGAILRVSPERMEGLRSRFLNHADLSVLLGRFVAVLRVLAGPMAGCVRMPYGRFFLFNLLGAVLWAGTMVSLAWPGLAGREGGWRSSPGATGGRDPIRWESGG